MSRMMTTNPGPTETDRHTGSGAATAAVVFGAISLVGLVGAFLIDEGLVRELFTVAILASPIALAVGFAAFRASRQRVDPRGVSRAGLGMVMGAVPLIVALVVAVLVAVGVLGGA